MKTKDISALLNDVEEDDDDEDDDDDKGGQEMALDIASLSLSLIHI